MYKLKPFGTYALDVLQDDAEAMARVERVLFPVGVPMDSVRVFSASEAPDVIREINAWEPEADGAIPWQHQRALLFTRIRVDEAEIAEPLPEASVEGVSRSDLKDVLGHIQLVRDTHSQDADGPANLVCWNTQDFGIMRGCPHGCQYCGTGKRARMIVLSANLEEHAEKIIGPTIEKNPGQKCFRLIGWGADIATFEPEYGAFELFLSKLAEHEGRYGYFHTGGDNVDWVADVPHRDRLIGIWSLTSEAGAEIIEPGSPSTADRLAAARKCQSWGLPIRFKLKPVVPVKNWREEYARTIEMIFQHTRPESIGFCVLMWMKIAQLEEMIDPDLLDPEFVDAARGAADTLADVRTGPFPHALRAEVYRFLIEETRKHDERVPIYISTESREMWDELKDELGQNPRSFICGCNPIEAPGPRMIPSEHLAHSTYFAGDGSG